MQAEIATVEELTELEEYQEFVDRLRSYRPENQMNELVWAVTGLTSEAGEVAGEVEKLLRNEEEIDVRYDKIKDELSDVLYYCGAVANALGLSLDDVILHNIDKLTQRHST